MIQIFKESKYFKNYFVKESKLKRFGLKNPRLLTVKDPRRFGYLNQLELCVVRLKKDKWFLDSGCPRHMTGDESKFSFLTKKK